MRGSKGRNASSSAASVPCDEIIASAVVKWLVAQLVAVTTPTSSGENLGTGYDPCGAQISVKISSSVGHLQLILF